MCDCKLKSKKPAGPIGNFNYKYECAKGGRTKVFSVTAANDNEGKRLVELECEEWIPAPDSGGGCFDADTCVLMADGSKRRIEVLGPGDMVMGGFGMPGEVVRSPVLNKFVTEHLAFCVVHLSSGEVFVMSQRQALVTASGLVQAKRIFPGTPIVTIDRGNTLCVSPITVVSVHSAMGTVKLHSLELQEGDFFFVGESLMGGGCDTRPPDVKQ